MKRPLEKEQEKMPDLLNSPDIDVRPKPGETMRSCRNRVRILENHLQRLQRETDLMEERLRREAELNAVAEERWGIRTLNYLSNNQNLIGLILMMMVLHAAVIVAMELMGPATVAAVTVTSTPGPPGKTMTFSEWQLAVESKAEEYRQGRALERRDRRRGVHQVVPTGEEPVRRDTRSARQRRDQRDPLATWRQDPKQPDAPPISNFQKVYPDPEAWAKHNQDFMVENAGEVVTEQLKGPKTKPEEVEEPYVVEQKQWVNMPAEQAERYLEDAGKAAAFTANYDPDWTPDKDEADNRRGEQLRIEKELLMGEGELPAEYQPYPRGALAEPNECDVEVADCTHPLFKQAILPTSNRDCAQSAPVRETKNVTQRILQRAQFVYQKKAKFCTVRYTQAAFYCGNYDHMTWIDGLTGWNLPWDIDEKGCEQLHRDLKFEGQELTLGEEVIFARMISGSSWYTEDGSEGKCKSAMPVTMTVEQLSPYNASRTGYTTGHTLTYHGLVMRRQYSVLIQEVNVKVDLKNYDVYDEDNGLKLLEKYQKGYSMGVTGTHVWDVLQGNGLCPLYRVRDLYGTELSSEDGTIFVPSTVEIRMIHRAVETHCGVPVVRTQYQELFLYDIQESSLAVPPSFIEFINPLEVSSILYSNTKVEAVYHDVTQYVEDLFRNYMRGECKRQKALEAAAYADAASEQASVMVGDTAALGNAWYLTASGEVYYRYRCRPVIAKVRKTQECYNALPLELSHSDRSQFIRSRVMHQSRNETFDKDHFVESNRDLHNIEFFAEPKTRLLVTSATIVPCSSIYPSLWRNTRGNWISVGKEIRHAATPLSTNLNTAGGIFDITKPKNIDFENGLYTPEQVREGERVRDIAGRKKEVALRILDQIGRVPPTQRTYHPGDMFSTLQGIDFNLWGAFMKWIEKWGGFFAFWALVLFGLKLLITIIQGVYKSYMLRLNGGDCFDVVAALLLPDFLQKRVRQLRERRIRRDLGEVEAPPDGWKSRLFHDPLLPRYLGSESTGGGVKGTGYVSEPFIVMAPPVHDRGSGGEGRGVQGRAGHHDGAAEVGGGGGYGRLHRLVDKYRRSLDAVQWGTIGQDPGGGHNEAPVHAPDGREGAGDSGRWGPWRHGLDTLRRREWSNWLRRNPTAAAETEETSFGAVNFSGPRPTTGADGGRVVEGVPLLHEDPMSALEGWKAAQQASPEQPHGGEQAERGEDAQGEGHGVEGLELQPHAPKKISAIGGTGGYRNSFGTSASLSGLDQISGGAYIKGPVATQPGEPAAAGRPAPRSEHRQMGLDGYPAVGVAEVGLGHGPRPVGQAGGVRGEQEALQALGAGAGVEAGGVHLQTPVHGMRTGPVGGRGAIDDPHAPQQQELHHLQRVQHSLDSIVPVLRGAMEKYDLILASPQLARGARPKTIPKQDPPPPPT